MTVSVLGLHPGTLLIIPTSNINITVLEGHPSTKLEAADFPRWSLPVPSRKSSAVPILC